MTISTRAELIKHLKEGDPKEVIVYTYWASDDVADYEDKDQAYDLIDEALENAIGSVNEYLESQYEGEGE